MADAHGALQHEMDKVLTEIARIQAMQDEALPLLTAERDRLRALALERDSGLAMDLAHDESDGGLGVTELP